MRPGRFLVISLSSQPATSGERFTLNGHERDGEPHLYISLKFIRATWPFYRKCHTSTYCRPRGYLVPDIYSNRLWFVLETGKPRFNRIWWYTSTCIIYKIAFICCCSISSAEFDGGGLEITQGGRGAPRKPKRYTQSNFLPLTRGCSRLFRAKSQKIFEQNYVR